MTNRMSANHGILTVVLRSPYNWHYSQWFTPCDQQWSGYFWWAV